MGVLCIVAFFFFCRINYSSNYQYGVYCEFRLCVTTTLSVAAQKAVGLSPYPYKFFRKDGYNENKNRNIKIQGNI